MTDESHESPTPPSKSGALDDMDPKAASIIHRLEEIAILLSSEKNLDRLLERIVTEACDFLNADGGTLYLIKDRKLHFTISQNTSLGVRLGGATGEPVSFPPVPMDPSFVSAYAAIHRKTVNVPDVYFSKEFDFTGPKQYDEKTGYRSVSMLVIPMMNHESEVIGVLQLLNAKDKKTGRIVPFRTVHESLAESLASQAAIAITNSQLIKDTERLFESVLTVLATAMDARSQYTQGHVRRVANLTLELAQAINEADEGPFADRMFSEDEINELRIAALMHDIGKIVTPIHVVDKQTKLETIFDRAELMKTRYELIAATARNESLNELNRLLESGAAPEKLAKERQRFEAEREAIAQEREFVLQCNSPGEFMEDEKIERLERIAQTTFSVEGHSYPRLNEDELKNLSVRRGSLTDEERLVINSHVVMSIKMLEKIPFTRKLKHVPLYAGGHHERIDGSGYPQGIGGEQLPLQARMLALIDIFEAVTAKDRPYRKHIPLSKAYAILQDGVDRGHLDRDIFDLIKHSKVFERYLKREHGAEAVDIGIQESTA